MSIKQIAQIRGGKDVFKGFGFLFFLKTKTSKGRIFLVFMVFLDTVVFFV